MSQNNLAITSLKKNTIWMVLGNVIYALTQWLLIILVAKFGSPELVGVFIFGFAVTAPVIMFANLRLRLVLASDSEDENHFSDYLVLRIISTTLAFIVIVLITFSLGLEKYILVVVLTIAVAKCFEAISDIFYGILQKHEKMKEIAFSMLIKSFLSLLCFGSLMYYSHVVFYSSIGLALAWGGVLLLYDVKADKYISVKDYKLRTVVKYFLDLWHILVDRNKMNNIYVLARKALPLGAVALLTSLSTNIPRYVIQYEFGERLLGFYAAISYIMIAGVLVLSSAGQSALPRIARHINNNEFVPLKKLFVNLITFAVVCGIAGWLISYHYGEFILLHIYGEEYAQYASELNWLLVAAGFNYIALFLWYTLTAMKQYKAQLYIFLLDVILIFILSVILIPKMEILGAIFTINIIMLFHVLVGGYIVSNKLNILEKGGVIYETKYSG